LKQNLRDIDELMPVVSHRVDLQHMWDTSSSVLQVHAGKGQRAYRNKRINRHLLEHSVYTMNKFNAFKCEAAPQDVVHDQNDDGGSEDGRPVDPVDGQDRAPDSFGRLVRDYFHDILSSRVGAFFSVRSDEGDHEPFQLVSFRQNVSLVKTHRNCHTYVCKLGIARLSIRSLSSIDTGPCLRVLEVDDPEYIDLTSFIHDVHDRDRLFQWTEVQSDVEGAICLVNPEIVQPTAKLNSLKVPVLCLVDALKAEGFAFVDRMVTHRVDNALKLVDARNMASQRHYFQCVLGMTTLWARGVTEFRSGRTNSWYLLLLHNKLDGITPANLKSRLAEVVGDEIEVAALQRTATLHSAAPVEVDIAGDEVCSPQSSDIAGDLGPETNAGADVGDCSSPSSPSSIAGDVEPGNVAGDASGSYEPPTQIDGCTVTVESHVGGFPGLRVRCRRHANCRKFSAVCQDLYSLGPRSAEFFLGAWLQLPASDRVEHVRAQPSRDQVLAYARSHPS
jgi:hypothetical protein